MVSGVSGTFLPRGLSPGHFGLFEGDFASLGGGDESRYEVGGGGVVGLLLQDAVKGPDVAGAPGGQFVG